MRRKGLYGAPPPAAPPAAEPIVPLCGARAMAEALSLTTKQFERLLEANRIGDDAIPVQKIPGLGLSADRRTLLAWWARKLGAATAA